MGSESFVTPQSRVGKYPAPVSSQQDRHVRTPPARAALHRPRLRSYRVLFTGGSLAASGTCHKSPIFFVLLPATRQGLSVAVR